MSNKNITQLPVNTNLSTIEGFAAVDIGGANVQISGQSIINSIDAVTSVLSSNTALLTVTGGNVPTITVNTAPIAKGGTGLATADQIATYVSNAIGSSTLAWVTDANGIYYDAGNVGIGTGAPNNVLEVSGSTGKLKVRLDDDNSNSTNQLLITSDEDDYTNFMSIATTTPDAQLDFGLVGPSSTLKVVGNPNDSFIAATSAADNMNFINNAGVGTTDNIAFYAGKTVGTDLSATTPDIIILGDGANRGYVGIGTETPLDPLHLKNNNSSIYIEDTQNTPLGSSSIGFWEPSGRRGFLGFVSGMIGSLYELFISNDVHGSSTKIYTTTTGGTTNIGISIDSDQNVSIPNGNLDVNGGITASGIPSYDDDSAAGIGGLSAGEVYQTTGTGAAPLDVAGILMIKQ